MQSLMLQDPNPRPNSSPFSSADTVLKAFHLTDARCLPSSAFVNALDLSLYKRCAPSAHQRHSTPCHVLFVRIFPSVRAWECGVTSLKKKL
mmetsp:Transcript_44267/g.118099  ORF Transcript_44267/g.118099 Transcript_44267/m.118099 type:complete len:91 (-) Transcript_44267:238-510(-)